LTEEPLSNDPTTEHLRTDHLLHDIGSRAVSGGFVTVVAQAAKFGLTFAGAAILARLLSPEEFGLIGMVLGVNGVVGIFNELGLSTATVQRQTITQQQVSNLFWVNVGVSGFVSLASCSIAPLLAMFYKEPRVTWIMVGLSFMFLLTGSTVQHRAVLTRQMRFSAIAIIEVSSMFAGFVAACLLAWVGFGYWALVAQQLTNSLAGLVLTWIVSKWRPDRPRRNSGMRPLLSFGAHLTIADFIARVATNSDNLLIGRFFGAVQLGLYTRASVLLARPLDQVMTPLNAVMDPVLARLQSDPERYRRTFLRTLNALAMLTIPFSASCMALSRPLVLVVLGPKWTAVIPLFSAYTLVAISFPLGSVVSLLYQSQGRGKDQLINHSISGVLVLIAYMVGLQWGPVGLILSLATMSVIVNLPIVYYIAGRSGPVSTKDLWLAFLSHLPAFGTVYIATLLTRMAVATLSPFLQVLICAPMGLTVGYALLMPFRRYREDFLSSFKVLKSALFRS
jgi:PST family polysaccharide transporter